ncbi:MAG TPA: sarcosine oxidase subunit delta [Geminicoccus sp.]|jgi:heterotetrameric sarcosine oxidase delta subunit|uniref:sarcosine oxidase subunit delta n=1 Tax=Geminicoccus sp. TaxID=2024832 RepID=UPI002E35D23D|nr:sarcosine oxidase subunit delta [Geminicoccus sp.]HEX2526695.1 sarcosine oxidase subunit delta [Geminicoccus sp.]
MLLIACPWCGPRDETEFRFGIEAGVTRPEPDAADDRAWAAYLFLRENHRGRHRELWCHAGGCGQWFLAERDTVTHRIERTEVLPGHPSTEGRTAGEQHGAMEAPAPSETVMGGAGEQA